MAQGRKPLPANVHLLRGNPSKKPHHELVAQAQIVPTVDGLPCPRWIKGEARREWNWIAPKLARYGLISELDRAALEQYVTSYARWRDAEAQVSKSWTMSQQRKRDGSVAFVRNPWLTISERAFRQVQGCLLLLGLCPTSRAMILSKPREISAEISDTQDKNDPLGILGGRSLLD